MSNVQLLEKVKKIPPEFEHEVEDFIDSILNKKTESNKLPVKRVIGLLKGKLKMAPDFDDPLEDLKDYM